jgi:cysteine dioxygenase
MDVTLPIRSAPPLVSLVRDLIALGDPRTRTDEVTERIAAFATHPFDVAPLVKFAPHGYTRTLLHRDRLFELLLVCWSPGSRSPIHDHDGQDCWLQPLAGALDLEDFAFRGDRITCIRRRVTVETIDHRDEAEPIHRVTAPTPAVSLHVYARPLDHCRVYDEHGRAGWLRLRYDRVRRVGPAGSRYFFG